jgi:restriction endonuclease S subunit
VTALLLGDLVTDVQAGDWCDAEPGPGTEECAVLRATDFTSVSRSDIASAPRRFLRTSSIAKRKLVGNDLLVEMSGGSAAQPTGRLVRVPPDLRTRVPVVFSNFVKRLRLRADVDPEYFEFAWTHLYVSGRTRRYEKRTTGIRNFRLDDFLASESVPLPPMPAQQRTAQALATIQRARDARQAVVDETILVRAALSASVFRNVVGVSVKLGDIAAVKGGKRLPKGRPFADSPTPYPYIRIVDFVNGSVDATHLKYLLTADREAITRYIIRADDVYISIAGSIGIVGTVPLALDGANLTENAARLVVHDPSSVSNRFLYWHLASDAGQAEVRLRTTKTSQPKLALGRIADIPVTLPSIARQLEIVAQLDAVQSKLLADQRSLAALEGTAEAALATLFPAGTP